MSCNNTNANKTNASSSNFTVDCPSFLGCEFDCCVTNHSLPVFLAADDGGTGAGAGGGGGAGAGAGGPPLEDLDLVFFVDSSVVEAFFQVARGRFLLVELHYY